MTSVTNKTPLRHWALMILILGTVIGIQTVKINRPYVGHFSSYQNVVMASMARMMMHENFSDLLNPKTDLIIGNQPSLHLNQYPFPSLFAAVGMRLMGGTLEFWGRGQAILFNLLSILLIGSIAASLFGTQSRVIAVLLFAFAPFSLINGQMFTSESMALTGLIFSLFFLTRPAEGEISPGRLTASALALSFAIAGRVHFAAILPVYCLFLLLYQNHHRYSKIIGYCFFSCLLPVLWFGYTYFASRQSDHILTGIFLQGSFWKLMDPFFLKNADYWRLILDLFFGRILTPLVFPFILLGLIFLPKRSPSFLLIAGGILTESLVVILYPQKVAEQDFYLFGALPFLTLAASYGISEIAKRFQEFFRPATVCFLIAFYLVLSGRYFFHPIYKYPEQGDNIPAIGRYVQNLSNPEDRVIACAYGPSDLFYYLDRRGWTIDLGGIGLGLAPFSSHTEKTRVSREEIKGLEEAMKNSVSWFEFLKRRGPKYFVSPRSDLDREALLLNYIRSRFKEISGPSDNFYFFDLSEPTSASTKADSSPN